MKVRAEYKNYFHLCLSAIVPDVPTGHIARVPSLILPFQYGPTQPTIVHMFCWINFFLDGKHL